MRNKRLIVVGLLFLFGCCTVLLAKKEFVLRGLGNFLYKADKEFPKSDVIVILRGGESSDVSRTLTAIELYREGYGEYLLVSAALVDQIKDRLAELAIVFPSAQERIYSICTQSGIDQDRIILDDQPPGGGTSQEIKRIINVMNRRGYKDCIIVSDWYHTRRVKAICSRLFPKDTEYAVVASTHSISAASNWWRYRYETINVLEEVPKLAVFYLSPFFKVSFADD